MTVASSSGKPRDEVKHRARRERIILLGEHTDEVRSHLTKADVTEIDSYQLALTDRKGRSPLERILNAPFPEKIRDRYSNSPHFLGLLACNTEMYDDVIEDMLDEDPLISDILDARNTSTDNLPYSEEQLTDALRIRRTIVTLAITAIQIEPSEIFPSPTAQPESENNSATLAS